MPSNASKHTTSSSSFLTNVARSVVVNAGYATQETVLFRNVSSLAAFVVLLWEYATTFGDEVKYIWCNGRMNRVKSIFLFIRYVSLMTSLTHLILAIGPLARVPVAAEVCRAWFLFLTVASCSIFAAVDVVVMLRVYALYNCNLRVCVLCITLLLLQAMAVTTCTSRTLGIVPFDGECNVTKTPHQVAYFTGTVVISHTILLVMTLVKRKVAFGNSPIVDLVIRDGAWMFVLIVSIFCVIVPYSIHTQVSQPHIVFVWPITFVSFAGCRLVINMQRAADHLETSGDTTDGNRRPRERRSTGITFTSFIDTSFS